MKKKRKHFLIYCWIEAEFPYLSTSSPGEKISNILKWSRTCQIKNWANANKIFIFSLEDFICATDDKWTNVFLIDFDMYIKIKCCMTDT